MFEDIKAPVVRLISAFLCSGLVMGCVLDPQRAADRLASAPEDCPATAEVACFFRNSPVKLLPGAVKIAGRSNDFFPIAQELEFVDGRRQRWIAPRRTLTDGASIPQIFVPIVGDPTTPEFVNAAAVHDAYCGIGNEDGAMYHSKTWQEVHRMFYDTLVVGGTPTPKAKLMFAAVWLGGPRWQPLDGTPDLTMDRLPAALRMTAMRSTRDYIATAEPTLPQLIRYLRWKEEEMQRLAYPAKARPAIAADGVEDPYDGIGGAGPGGNGAVLPVAGGG